MYLEESQFSMDFSVAAHLGMWNYVCIFMPFIQRRTYAEVNN